MLKTTRMAGRTVRWALAPGMALILTACGGGGGGGSAEAPPPAPSVTPLPDNLAIALPQSPDIEQPTAFGHTAPSAGKLQFSWDFGDGSPPSTEVAPKHQFAQSGEYEVKLKVTNEAGQSREVKSTVVVNNQAALRGLECSGPQESGWCWQAPRPTGHPYRAMTFVNATTGFRVGAHGEIFKTADAGKTWVRQASGVTADLYEVVFQDEKTGWARGANQALLSTTDGGATWTSSALPFTYTTESGRLTSQPNGVLEYADAGYFAQSLDGGKTWTAPQGLSSSAVSVGGEATLVSNGSGVVRWSSAVGKTEQVLDFKGSDGKAFYSYSANVYALGNRSAIATARDWGTWDATQSRYVYVSGMWRSDDAGKTWTRFSPTGLPQPDQIAGIQALDAAATKLIAQQGSVLYRSEDGGLTWTSASSTAVSDLRSVVVAGKRIFAAIGYQMVYSDDIGRSWYLMPLPAGMKGQYYGSPPLRRVGAALLLSDASLGDFFSVDGGATWVTVQAMEAGRDGSAHAASFWDARNGALLNAKGQLFLTADAGKTWKLSRSEMGVTSDFSSLKRLQFTGAKTGFLLGADNRMYRTVDGGQSWNTEVGSTAWRNFSFSDVNRGWGQDVSGKTKFTKDGGKTFQEIVSPTYQVFDMRVDANGTLTAVGYQGQLFQSSDDGKTWAARYTGTGETLYRVYSRDDKTMWAIGAGGTVLRSDNAGVRWTRVLVPVPQGADLRDITFADARNGWIVGSLGTILVTRDGGNNWAAQASGTRKTLHTVQMLDVRTGWIVGDGGTLLATGTGGH